MIEVLKVSLLIIIIGCGSINENKISGFILEGKTNGIDDGTVVQLYDVLSEQVVDSVEILNNRFKFTGELKTPEVLMTVQMEDLSQYKSIWLENKSIKFDASNSSFTDAKVTGSEIHRWVEDNILSKDTIEIREKKDINRKRELHMQIVEKYPNNIATISMLALYVGSFERERIEKLYNKFPNSYKESGYGKRIEEFLDLKIIQYPKIGDQYIDFAMSNITGEDVVLSDYLKEVTLLEFWSSSCDPCRKENPRLVKTYEKYKNKGFTILSVSLDRNVERWKDATIKDGLSWTQVSDLKGSWNKAALLYNVTFMPDNFLIDSNGQIIGRNLRGENLDIEIEKVLNKMKPAENNG